MGQEMLRKSQTQLFDGYEWRKATLPNQYALYNVIFKFIWKYELIQETQEVCTCFLFVLSL